MTHDEELGSHAASPDTVDAGASDLAPEPAETAETRSVTEPAETPETAEPPAEQRRGCSPTAVVIVLGLCVLAAAVIGVWAYISLTFPVATPAVVSLTPKAAETVLHNARLVAGRATYEVTSQFPSGRIIAQSPLPYAPVAQGSPVDIKVAVAPTTVRVPDVVGAPSNYAESVLNYYLLTPTVLYAYSTEVRTSQVIEQLPRAGDTAVTGSADVIVISLGPGIPGSVVPHMIGKTFVSAASEASAAALFAQPRLVVATGTPNGTVVDQAPSAGTIVPVATNVWVSVAEPAPKK